MRYLIRVACLAGLGLARLLGQSESRPMTVEDLFSLSELRDVALSPDGDRIAATITRPGSPNACPTCNYVAAGDVWLIDLRTGVRTNVTNGGSDRATSFLPVWSPDGRRLALASTRSVPGEAPGPGNIRPWVYDLASQSLSRLGDRGIWMQVEIRNAAGPDPGPLAWVSDTTLLVALLQPGVAADQELLYWRRGVAEATRAWGKWSEGKEPTASVLESGAAAPALPTVTLAAIDVTKPVVVPIAELPKWDLWDLGLVMQVAISPDRARAAVLPVTGTIGLRDRALSDAIRTYRACAVRLREPGPVVWAALDPGREHVDGRLLGWSRDGHEFLVSEAADLGSRPPRRTTLAVTASEGVVREVTSPEATASRAAGQASIRQAAAPTRTARVVAGDPAAGRLVFRDDSDDGISLWVTDAHGLHPSKCLTVNEHVATIAAGRRKLVSYHGADGDALQGLAILPPGWEPGRRYPTVTWVYGGLVIRDADTPLASKLSTRPLNLELLAAHGYVVLLPSVPLAPFGVKSDPWVEVPKGVLPCVDKLVELGIADPDRLAVMGHSTGGYCTYAVVTYTNRFRAAIALSGHPDLVSLHGQFYPGERFNPRAHEGLATTGFVEYGPMALGGPPWDELGRYVRNTPLFWFDRVQTPLMIVHGDMDGAPIQQGEEAFMALWRQGKRARFVRYWGEGHVVSSPPNVRHLWSQIFEWLDTHLAERPQSRPK